MLQIPLPNRLAIILVLLAGVFLAMPNVFYPRVERHNDAALAIAEIEENNARATGDQIQPIPERLLDELALWPEALPSGLVNLGLDLRGGAHLLAEVQLEDVYAARMEALWPEVREALRDARGEIGSFRRQEGAADELVVQISNPEGLQTALRLVRALSQPVVTLTGVGASTLDISGAGDRITITLSEAERAATDDRTILQSLEIIRRRVDEAGTREPTIQRQGNDRILIQVPGLGSAQELRELIGTTARLTFHPVINPMAGPDTDVTANEILLPSVDGPGFYVLERAEVVSGEQLTDAQPAFDQRNRPAVTFNFDGQGTRAFCEFTRDNVGQPFAIVLDDEVISAPVINEAICGGAGQITGNFDVAASVELAVLLRAGALPAELSFLEEQTIGPELGADSIAAGRIAAVVAFAAVLVFMALSYGRFGLFANAALILNVIMIFGLLSLIGATLTLPGIAGIVLTIGMAVDANVLVFERIREELKSAKGPARAIELGYERALSAIIDANITTFLTASILYVMGSGPVRGFAITLGLGILTSVFTAIFVTRLFVVMWFERRRPKVVEV